MTTIEPDPLPSAWRRHAPDALAGLMGLVGSLHFVVTDQMADTVPAWVPAPRAAVLATGVLEVGCAIAQRRRWRNAGPVAAATLLAVWPANWQMAIDASGGAAAAVLWARVPLQVPMIWAALQARPDDAG